MSSQYEAATDDDVDDVVDDVDDDVDGDDGD